MISFTIITLIFYLMSRTKKKIINYIPNHIFKFKPVQKTVKIMSKRFYFKGNPMQLLLLIVKKKQQQRRFLKIEQAKFLWFRKWFFLPPSLSASGYSFHAWLFRSHGFNLSKLQKLVFCVISRPISFWRKKLDNWDRAQFFFCIWKYVGRRSHI